GEQSPMAVAPAGKPRSQGRAWFIIAVELALLFVGAAGGFAAFIPLFGLPVIAVCAALTSSLVAGSHSRGSGRAGRMVRWTSRLALLPVAGFFAYEVLAFGSLLGWAIPWWGWAATGLAAGAS